MVSFKVVIVSEPAGKMFDTTLDTASWTKESRSSDTGSTVSSSTSSVGLISCLYNNQ